MLSIQEKAQAVLWYAEFKSIIKVQREFRRVYNKAAPDSKRIKAWHTQFLNTGSVEKRHGGGRRVSDEHVENVREAFQRSPRKSIRQASRELQMPRTTVHHVLRKRLHLYAYKVQIMQALQPEDKPQRYDFACDMLDRCDQDPAFLSRIMFSDEATFHISGTVNRHNVRIWGMEHPHSTMEHLRDSPKVNVWCGLMCDTIIGPFFFAEMTVTGTTYLDMLEQYAFPQVEHLQPNLLFQQDGAPPHWSLDVRRALDATFPGRWVGRDGPIRWPPRSPDITPLDFFLWGYVKDKVYATAVRDLRDLRARIVESIAAITPDMLARTWTELDYRLNILRVTKGAHVEIV